MKKLLLLPLLLISSVAIAQTRDFTRWVNPFIGTGGHGHTFPGATLPFGMVQLSPDTRIDNWDGSSGYHYSDDVIYGFSHTHLSGTGIPDGCDILFMPMVGDPQFFAKEGDKSVNGYASKFSHANEKAEPGYYSVKLDDNEILAEMTATKRVGLHRYTFPKTDNANIVIDLKWRDSLEDSRIDVVDDKRIEGYRRSSSWAKHQQVFFVAEFSKPYSGLSLRGPTKSVLPGTTTFTRLDGTGLIEGAIRFDAFQRETIMLKVAISYVSLEGARKNLEAELPGWDFDKVRADAKAAWNKELSKIEVSGGSDDQTTIFYTALYHTMIHPNVFNDVDGKYKGHDEKIHSLRLDSLPRRGEGETRRRGDPAATESPRPRVSLSPRHEDDQYTVFSLWDTFRAAHPLYTIIDQKRTVDFINTFIRIYEQGGRLPVWELWGEETDTMIGYHAVSVIADAMAKGIKGFDYEKAYAAAKHSAELDHVGLAGYKQRGYVSTEDDNESVSKTLEYAYDDWCIAQMARLLSKKYVDELQEKADPKKVFMFVGGTPTSTDRLTYEQRARSFENLFDPRVSFFVPRKNGGFIRPFAPNEVTFHFTEGNSWQYSFFVPHDIDHLIELMGGRSEFADKLDELFTTDQKLIGREQPDITGLIGQYAHGNEPSHHIPYLFNYAGQSWKTQMYVRKIMDEFYKNSPDGLVGNEDCGQMSAWFVLSASGFYPVAPGSSQYATGTPLFPEVKYKLENGKTFVVRAKNVSDKNFYVRDLSFNGKRRGTPTIEHAEIMSGGLLDFEMSDRTFAKVFDVPSRNWQPLLNTVAAPRIEATTAIFMATATAGARIYYTLDGSDPTERSDLYIAPFKLGRRDGDVRIRAVAIDSKKESSAIVEAKIHKRPNDWTVSIISPYSYQYTGGGDDAIVDGIRGSTNFASGEWQGYQGKTFEAVIDLQRETEIKNIGGSFLQSARSWIWIPDRVEFEVSTDGENFTRVADVKPNFPQQEMNPTIREVSKTIAPVKARYVRVRAFNIGKIPPWHPGAGGDPWIFVDEILIR